MDLEHTLKTNPNSIQNINLQPALVAMICGLMSALMISCTRAEDNQTTVSISVPHMMSSHKVGAQAADTLAHVVVNVSGEGIAVPIVFNWDLKEDGLGAELAKPIELVIPQGANRLIQVLAVYQDTTGDSMQFYYGDKVQSLSQASETVTMNVSSVSQEETIFTGSISGRYLTGANTGPTGIVTTSYVVSGRAPMIIDRDMMYSGWFSVMGIHGAKLSYSVLPIGGAPFALFEGRQVDLSEASFPPSATLARLTIPLSQRSSWGSGWVAESPSIYISGFWGATAGHNVCAYRTPVTTQYAIGDSVNPEADLLEADISGVVPTDFLTNPGLPAMYLQTAPGTEDGAGACSSVTEFTDSLTVTPQKADNGNDGAAGFVGPFRMTNARAFEVDPVDASTYAISATVLPGILDVVSGFKIYKKIGKADHLPDALPCFPEALALQGFEKLVDSALTTETWAENLAISTADISNQVNLAICPVNKATGQVYPVGVYVRSHIFSYVYIPPVQMPTPTPVPTLVVTQISNSLSMAGDRGSVVVDSANNLYYAAPNSYQIRKVTQAGVESVYAGTGTLVTPGSNTAADSASATSAGFMQPTLLAIDPSDDIYVADGLYIRKISAGGGAVTTQYSLGGSGNIRGLAVDSSGSVYFVNGVAGEDHKIQKVTGGGTQSVFAGSTGAGYFDGSAGTALFNTPASLAVDSAGNVFVADTGNFVIRKITQGGVVTTFAGTAGTPGYADGVGAAATFSFWNMFTPMAVDIFDNIYIGNMDGSGHNSIKVMQPNGTVETYCGLGSLHTNTGICATTSIYSRFGLAVGWDGVVYYADSSVLKRITP